jgi:outer membrane protein assembly factor BamB
MNRRVTPLILALWVQVPSIQAADWPQFRGPNRDGKSPETGLLKQWPETGPRLARTITGVGGGFSCPVIAGGRIYLTGKVGDDLKIFCFELSGKKIWERTHAPAFSERDAPHSPHPGARATPTLDGDMIYLLGGLGRLTAYRISNGEPVWSVDVVGELGGRVPVWDNRKLNCEHGGYVLVDGFIYAPQGVGWICLELKTGKERWFDRGPGTGSIAYADGMLYCLGENGNMGLLEANPAAFNMVSRFQLPKGEGPCWTHPVISDGELYLRWSENLYVYDIKE